MDTGSAVAAAVGATAGFVAGWFPGLHPNTLLPVVALASPSPLAIVAFAAAHQVGSILPATFVGVPGDAEALAALPAHKMARDGRARSAVRTALRATLAATLVAVVLVWGLKWLVGPPFELQRAIVPWIPWLLGGLPFWLAWQERAGGASAMVIALVVAGAAGLVGLLAAYIHPDGMLPASPLLFVLGGLFAGAGLALAATPEAKVPPAEETPSALPWAGRHGAMGGALAALTGLVPGLTAAVAASFAPTRSADPSAPLARMAGMAAAQPLLALSMLWSTGQARSGVAIALRGEALPWDAGSPPQMLWDVLFVWVAAVVVASFLLLRCEPAWARTMATISPRPLHLGLLGALALSWRVYGGAWGVAVGALATGVGILPVRWGVRRVHLTAAITLPGLVA